jgi:pimeloyl-ACP methyl ester carboxylesterase
VPGSPAAPDGSPAEPRPRLEAVGGAAPDATSVVLVLHGGRARSHEPAGTRRRLTYLRMLPFARMLRRAGPAVYMLRYRYRGWNDPDLDAYRDAVWAIAEIGRRHPGAPVVLLGHSMGGRAALRAGGADGVVAVCALAPWTDPRESYAYAVRAKDVTDRVCRFEVLGDGHAMLRRAGDWSSLVRRFVLAETGIEPEDPDIANAMRQPAPAGLARALTGASR